MEAEIVITGLCSILNPKGDNSDMGEPAVILVQTGHSHSINLDHIAFIAFNADEVDVTGAGTLVDVKKGKPFKYMTIAGVELVIEDNPPSIPTVDSTYSDSVAHRDEYWPEAKGFFDPDYVPPIKKRPKKTAVKAWMRFGKGTISASRVSEIPWRFTQADGSTFQDYFAEEVVYSGFPHSTDAVKIQLKDLENGADAGARVFTLKNPSSGKLTLIIGNSLEDDMAGAVFREITKFVKKPYADHFEFLNNVAGAGAGPVPTAINPLGGSTDPGGGSGGACGPGSGNGKP